MFNTTCEHVKHETTCEKAQMTFRMHKIKRTSDTCIRDLKILPFVFPNVKSHAFLIKSSLFFNAETTLELKFVSVGNYIILILICILVPRRFESHQNKSPNSILNQVVFFLCYSYSLIFYIQKFYTYRMYFDIEYLCNVLCFPN